jgi:hypothetical protein
MSFNPYSTKYVELESRVAELSKRADEIACALDWYDTLDMTAIHGQLRSSAAKSDELENEIAVIEKEISEFQGELADNASLVGSLFNPANWFTESQVALRRACRVLRETIDKKEEVKNTKTTSLNDLRENIEQLFSIVQRHDAFDSKREANKFQQIMQHLAEAESELEEVCFRKKQVDEKLAPCLKELSALEVEKQNAESKLRQARNLETRLSCASNSYERTMAHQDCESMFKTGSPRYAITQQEKLVRRINGDIEKTIKRAEDVSRKAARVIKKIVIDGNNLCYEADRFIGLPAIESVLPALSREYSIIVVFDSGIRGMLKVDDASLRKRFDGQATVHVVATRQSADETILDLASDDPHTCVLSNDRFADFNEKKVVKDDRIIRVEIVSGRVFVHDLDVNTSYKSGFS